MEDIVIKNNSYPLKYIQSNSIKNSNFLKQIVNREHAENTVFPILDYTKNILLLC